MFAHSSVFPAVLLLSFSAMTAMAGFALCPDTWVAYMEDCYLFGHMSADFTEAEVGIFIVFNSTYPYILDLHFNHTLTTCINIGIVNTGSSLYKEHFCRQHNGHLVHVETAAENDFIKDQLRFLIHQSWWMGLSDDLIENNWIWTDTNTTPAFTDWFPGQPTNAGGNEDCGAFWSDHDFQWNDAPCTLKYKPVCERSSSDEVGVIG